MSDTHVEIKPPSIATPPASAKRRREHLRHAIVWGFTALVLAGGAVVAAWAASY